MLLGVLSVKPFRPLFHLRGTDMLKSPDRGPKYILGQFGTGLLLFTVSFSVGLLISAIVA